MRQANGVSQLRSLISPVGSSDPLCRAAPLGRMQRLNHRSRIVRGDL